MGDWEASSPAAVHCSQCRVSSAEICKAVTQETQQHEGLGEGEGRNRKLGRKSRKKKIREYRRVDR